jgi:hypothetical protein
MSEFQHSVHFVGSYPAESAEAAMYDMASIGGDALSQMSDGETGLRKDWVVAQIESYCNNPAFELVKDGHWTSYEDCPVFKVTEGHELAPEDFGLRYHADAVASWSAFERVRNELNRPDLKFQVGIPHFLDMSLFTFGADNWAGLDPALVEAYRQATVDQIKAIRNEPFGDQVVFQIETPVSLSMSFFPQEALPPQLHPHALGESIAELAALTPKDTAFGVHLCVGDLGNKGRGIPASRAASVRLMNEMSAPGVWPEERPLLYIHEPDAAGDEPPIVDSAVYEDLRDLRLPKDTRYIAGMVHERASIEDQRTVLGYIVDALPENQALGLAAACGLGRRSLTVAQGIGERMVELARTAA